MRPAWNFSQPFFFLVDCVRRVRQLLHRSVRSASPPPPVNALPVVTSIFVKGTLSREPAQYATLGETVNVTATVTDAETPLNQLTYEWSSSVGGTFGGNATTTTWTAPASLTGATPVNATLTLTVTERVDATRNNRVTATSIVDLHNSPKEVGDPGGALPRGLLQAAVGRCRHEEFHGDVS